MHLTQSSASRSSLFILACLTILSFCWQPREIVKGLDMAIGRYDSHQFDQLFDLFAQHTVLFLLSHVKFRVDTCLCNDSFDLCLYMAMMVS